MRLKELLHNLLFVSDSSDCEITGISHDSRYITAGDLFVAYPGSHYDGRNYISDALKRGAAAILIEPSNAYSGKAFSTVVPVLALTQLKSHLGDIAARFYGYPSRGMRLIGITGTNGKTTCTHFLARCLVYAGEPCGIIGGVSSGIYSPHLGDYRFESISSSRLTTPDAIELQFLLHKLRQHRVRTVIVEVSSHGIAEKRIENLSFFVTALTNISHDHLDYHPNFDHYVTTKRRLFTEFNAQYLVLNQDDLYGWHWHQTWQQGLKPVFGYTTNARLLSHPPFKTCQAKAIANPWKIHAQVITPWGSAILINPYLIGQFNLSNLMLVLTVLGILNVPLVKSLYHLSRVKPVVGRMERVHHQLPRPMVIIDYAHTPDALEKTLKTLLLLNRKIWCVFGCGGNRDRYKRPLMGAIAERYAHGVILTQDNPRQEATENIITDILAGMCLRKNVRVRVSREQAILHAIKLAKPQDIVLIAGKGHENFQIIGDTTYPFSDHKAVKDALQL